MNVEKMRHWLEMSNKLQGNDFWKKIFDHHPPETFFQKRGNYPLADCYQNDSSICLILEIPGVQPNDIHISLQSNSHLLIKGMIKPLFPKEMVINTERFYGEFERVIHLPEPTEPHLIQIHYHQGLIQVTYPRQNIPLPINLFS
ncbi:Hsp20/alpha crystallin family protein [Neobacillus sp. D3-1R]|uniref:Hsp20/alpha crystallin family protein n=1 Tax=Neobacillus sp. D3-1R TaxID=3445778 RepID=UPI003F9EFF5D